jgi:hypothetical protein
LVVFVFKTSSQTLSYSNKTCFAVLKTENLFSKQQPNRLRFPSSCRLRLGYIN